MFAITSAAVALTPVRIIGWFTSLFAVSIEKIPSKTPNE
jgi:hypothetical protein